MYTYNFIINTIVCENKLKKSELCGFSLRTFKILIRHCKHLI